ncbi:hypothetical protein ACFX2H_013472 [Malus domestica]
MAKKKLARYVKKAATTMPTPPSKRPSPKAEMVGFAPQPKKRVKKFTKKREREIHVISSQTTGATPSVSPLIHAVHVLTRVQQNLPTDQAPEVHPVPSVMVELIVASLVEKPAASRSAVAPQAGLSVAVLEKVTTPADRNPVPNLKGKSVIVLEEEDESEGILLTGPPRPAKLPSANPQPTVEAFGQNDTSAVEKNTGLGMTPLTEPKATTKTPAHLHDQDLCIPSQEATLTFVRHLLFS